MPPSEAERRRIRLRPDLVAWDHPIAEPAVAASQAGRDVGHVATPIPADGGVVQPTQIPSHRNRMVVAAFAPSG